MAGEYKVSPRGSVWAELLPVHSSGKEAVYTSLLVGRWLCVQGVLKL